MHGNEMLITQPLFLEIGICLRNQDNEVNETVKLLL
jgi:hypothetical protein